MIVECPHCFLRVFVANDGICPKCRRDVNDLTGADVTKIGLLISPSAPIPSRCVCCGSGTMRRVPVQASMQYDSVEHELTTGSYFCALSLVLLPLVGLMPL